MDINSIDHILDEAAKNSQPIWQVVLSEEQKDWLLVLLMNEKQRVDDELKAEGGGHI